MASASIVTVGVPVYHGADFVEEALRSLQAQTHREIRVMISLDGPDPVCEALCRPFLRDTRFFLTVQRRRLGWVAHLNWLMSGVRTPYWCYHQQDDVLDPRYFEVLVAYADRTPEAAVTYCDMSSFGDADWTFAQPSVTGSPRARQLALLSEHLSAVAFRGVTRAEALRISGGIPPNEVDSFACDTAWMSAIARGGELHRVPEVLYRKRYHAGNVHTKWAEWPLERLSAGWVAHCAAMLEQAMLVEAEPHERRLLWLAAAGRLTSPRTAARYLPLAELGRAERIALLDAYLLRVRGSLDVAALLGAPWDEIERWTRGFFEPAG
ncbi:MAG TPA: glycosyltransferase family A protein [Candidatus Elarobacter sp.]|jgi:GT2 family glycosyltransferase